MSMLTSTLVPAVVNAEEPPQNRDLLQPQRGARERELLQGRGDEEIITPVRRSSRLRSHVTSP
ncbi:hypothetical protein L484_000565 [Morus notabilis]|uniref:Uncharacterized protein n=1 Tax=Morus notabilis TaxID=981085 RepID=W9SPU7_9ROSA|nr:hypothetical protein L484_000565 [Morus notabilis]